jgi:hypothetical protein
VLIWVLGRPPAPQVDQLCPVLLALMNSIDKLSGLPPNYQPREKIRVRAG